MTRGAEGTEDAPACYLKVWVHPGGRREGIGWSSWRLAWEVHVRAEAVEGRANEAVMEVIARALGIARAQVDLVVGARGREKRLRVRGLTEAEAAERLRRAPHA